MATLKAVVKTKSKNGMYKVYIRFTQNRMFSYMSTSWMVTDQGLSDDKKDITDPYVIQQTSILIERCYSKINQVDTSKWSAKEVMEYVMVFENDFSFSDHARKHIQKMIDTGHQRNAKNYRMALNSMERFGEVDNVMFSRITSAFLNRWIESLSKSNRCKEQYPVCMREVYKAALRDFNDEERGLIKLKNPWGNVKIPKSDIPEQRAIPASMIRKFFNVVPDRSRYSFPLMEVGQDVALISFCMCGLNSVDMFVAKKDQYKDGIFHYERQKTRTVRSDRGYLRYEFQNFLSRLLKSIYQRILNHHGFLIFMIVWLHLIPSVPM